MAYDVPIPPWLQSPGPQVGALYSQGFSSGAHVAAQNRAMEEALVQNEREYEMKKAALEESILKAKQEMLIDREYKNATVALRAQGLDVTREKQKLAADLAARKYAAQQDAGRRLQAGESFEQALFHNPDLMTSGVTEAMIRGRQAQKEYGVPITEDIPGLPGAKMIYRKGSPGVHVAIPPRTGLTPMQQVKVQGLITQAHRSQTEMTEDDPLQKDLDRTIKAYSELLTPPEAITAPPGSAPVDTENPEVPVSNPDVPVANPKQSVAPGRRPGFNRQVDQYLEGTVMRRKDGTVWQVQQGHLVPFADPDAQAQAEPTEEATPPEE